MLIADFQAVKEHLGKIIEELSIGGRLFFTSRVFLMQHMVDLGGGICEVEKRALRDLGEHAGATHIFILPYTEPFSTEKATYGLTMGLKGGASMPPNLTW